jgi:hypothetical protein
MQLMNFPPAVAILLTGAVTLMIGSAFVISAMIGEVNRRLPKEQQATWGIPGNLGRSGTNISGSILKAT